MVFIDYDKTFHFVEISAFMKTLRIHCVEEINVKIL